MSLHTPPPTLTRPVYTYTASAFANAPDSISRVISQHAIGNHEIALRVSVGTCVGRSVPPYTIIVSATGTPHFSAGTLVMTGGVTRAGVIVSVIRRVTPAELRRIGCKAAQKG